jgi:hypothetical protein
MNSLTGLGFEITREDPYYKDILHMFEKSLDQNLSKQEL